MFQWTSVTLLALLLWTSPVEPYSTGAPTCIPGVAAPGVDHKFAGYEQRTLEDGFIEIKIDGQPLVKGVTFGIPVGQDVTVTLIKATPFKGIMTRIDGGSENIDTSLVFDFLPGEEVLRRNDQCEADVGGITHGSANPTTSMSWIMRFDEPSQRMRLDMNIVETRTPVSRFYYDAFFITALAPGETLEPQTEPPTPSPTPPNAQRPIGNGEPDSGAIRSTTVTVASVVVLALSTIVAGLWAPF